MAMEKLLPSPGSLVTWMAVPIKAASRAQIDRPMPAPRTRCEPPSIW